VIGGESFDDFYRGSYPRLLRQVVLVAGSRVEAEDALQEAYARAAARWGLLRHYDVPEAWVRVVAMRLVAEVGRRARRRAAALLRLGPPAEAVPELSAATFDLHVALRALPVGQRQVIVLHYLVGQPINDIADQLGLPLGTVKSRLWRARAALASLLDAATDEVIT
jgi:RNA polymerase sigma factor (sigma-70 family)